MIKQKYITDKRKGYNFYKSYWDSYKMLTKDKDKLEFLETICKIQFLEIHIDDVNPNSYELKLLFSSIKHSLETSILGYCSQKSIDYDTHPCKGASKGASKGACQQVQVKEKEQVKRIPTKEEVIIYAKSRNREDLAVKFFDYYDAGNWEDVKGNKVKNWKQKFITWENKQEKQDATTETKEEKIWRLRNAR